MLQLHWNVHNKYITISSFFQVTFLITQMEVTYCKPWKVHEYNGKKKSRTEESG